MTLKDCTASLAFALLGAFASGAACAPPRATPAPRTEFLVSAGDSTYWVTSDSAALKLRGAPLLLARVDGRFVEIYAADDDRSYADALFVGQRLFARDLIRGDSVVLMADTVVPRLAAAYARAHPREQPLAPDDEANPSPSAIATAQIEVLAVHGSFVSYEYHVDIESQVGERHAATHRVRHGVLDLRTGSAVRLGTVVGEIEARRAELAAARQWDAERDSLVAQSPAESRRELQAIAFDPASFALADSTREPQAIFALPSETHGESTPRPPTLSPITVAAPLWWGNVREQLPTGADSLRQWTRTGLSVIARENGEHARLLLRDGARREFNVGVIAAPVERLHWLDASVNAETRTALRKAFSDAALYSEGSRVAARAPAETTYFSFLGHLRRGRNAGLPRSRS